MAKPRKKPSARKRAQQNAPEGKRGIFSRKAETAADKKSPEQKPELVAGHGTVIQSQASRLGVIAAWTVVSLLILGVVVALFMAARPTQAQAPAVDTGADATTQRAGEYARGFVATWLRADSDSEEELAAYQSASDVELSLTGTEAVGFRDLAVASVEEQNNGIITVYVSADLEAEELVDDEAESETDGEGAETQTTWNTAWYQVNIFPQEDDFSILGYPAPVAAPESVDAPSLGYNEEAPEPVVTAVEDFFGAYLLDDGDVGRMIHPDSDIEPITTIPYEQVSVSTVSLNEQIDDEIPEEGTQVKARTEIEVGGADATRPATYSLTLQSRGGRWEILSVDSSPELYVSDDGEASTPTQTPDDQTPAVPDQTGEADQQTGQPPETETTDEETEETSD